MKEYIERAALIDDFEHCGTSKEIIKAIVDRINLHPAADVAEVRHGRWIVHFDHFAPLVATENEVEMCFYKHCPECTARMDKEAEHETS